VKAVVAVGCLVQRYQSELRQEMPEVDLFLGFSDLHHLVPELASRGLIDDPVAAHPGVRQFLGEQAHVRYLKISEGCDHTCAFCAIPLMRGTHRSEPLERLVREAQALEAQGAREVNLVAQDLGHYGRDLAGRGRSSRAAGGVARADDHSMVPPAVRLFRGISERLVELIAREPRILPYIDMPIQHANDRMLERMRRPERQASLREKLAGYAVPSPISRFEPPVSSGFRARPTTPSVSSSPSSRSPVRPFGAFAYSPQEGTRAMQYPDDVIEAVKRDRLEELLEVQRAISAERLARFVGRDVSVLVDRVADPLDGARRTWDACLGRPTTWMA
jgi:ribosomal protein S12 methylthiotransferase